MAWPSSYPVDAGDNTLLQYQHLLALWKAARERNFAAGGGAWPAHIWAPDGGTITAMTATQLTDSTKAWGTSPKRWVSWTSGAVYDPQDYDVVIGNDDADPHELIRVRITDNGATTLTIDTIQSWVNSNYIASIASLVGKRYYICRRDGTYYPFWHQRWPRRPNDQCLAKGETTSGTTTTLTVTDAGWIVNQWAGKTLFVNDTAGIVQRSTISSNTDDTLTFAIGSPSWTAYGAWEIHDNATRVCWPGVLGDELWAWYRGYQEQVFTHLPNDTIGGRSKPANEVPVTLYNGSTCVADTISPALDVDVIIDFQEECNDRDKHFARDMFKTFRGLQAWAEGAAASFVEARRWNGSSYDAVSWDGEPYIDTMRAASLLRSAGINYHGSYTATANGSGDATFSVTGLPSPAPNYHYLVTPTGSAQVSAHGRSSSSSLTIGGLTAGESYTCVVSLGWTRRFPMMLRYLYPSTWFEPDLDGGAPADPPTSGFPGSWVRRAASTAILEYDDADGSIIESVSLPAGKKIRYVGDRWHDLGTAGVAGSDVSDPIDEYRMYGAARRHPEADELTLAAARSFTAKEGGTDWLRQISVDWFTSNWYAGAGTLVTHTGTATGGSTTTLTDTGLAGHPFIDGSTGRPVGQCLEIEVSSGQWEPRPVTAYNTGTKTFTVSPAFTVTASGKPWRIREPAYQLNRFEGRRVVITDPAGPTSYATTITHNSDRHLFFNAIAAAVQEDWTVEIEEIAVGSVVQT